MVSPNCILTCFIHLERVMKGADNTTDEQCDRTKRNVCFYLKKNCLNVFVLSVYSYLPAVMDTTGIALSDFFFLNLLAIRTQLKLQSNALNCILICCCDYYEAVVVCLFSWDQ